MDTDEILTSAIAEYILWEDRRLSHSQDECMGGQASVRSMMVRLGLYDKFCELINAVHEDINEDY